MLSCGKYKGKTFADISEQDRSYCAWVLRTQHMLSPSFQHFAEYLRRQRGGLLSVGRNKHKYFDELWLTQKDYCYWAASLENPHASLNSFTRWVQYKFQQEEAARSVPHWISDEEDEPPTKRAKVFEDKATECKICVTKILGVVFVPCGHMTCVACSEKMSHCPFCRALIQTVVRAFLN